MSFIQNIFSSRDNNADGNVYVGQAGRIWFNPITNTIYSSDGVTQGGLAVGAGGNSVPGGPTDAIQVNNAGLFGGSANLTYNDFDGLIVSKATIGNILIQADSVATIAANTDITLVTTGNSNIHMDTNGFHVHTTTNPNPVFTVNSDGEVQILSPVFDPLNGAVSIIGSSDGNAVGPQLNGVMLHLTGQPATPARIYNDGANAYSAYVGRRYNGNSATPSQVFSGDVISRIGATPYTDAGWPSISTSRIDHVATENQTQANLGTALEFWSTPDGTSAISKMFTIKNNAVTFFDGTVQNTAAIPLTYMANAFGVATLGADAKVLPSQLPAGAMVYKGVWNATTNTPTLVNGTGTAGWQYSVDPGGTRDLGAGPIVFTAGDFITYDGAVWNKISASAGVTTFNTRSGAVTLSSLDVTTALTYTPYNGNTNPLGFVNSSQVAGSAPVQTVFSRVGNVVLLSSDVTTALSPGSITNTKLENANVTIGNTTVNLGNTVTSITGLNSISASGLNLTGNLVFSNAASRGIQVDTTTPVWGWRDIHGVLAVRGSGPEEPAWTTYTGSLSQYQYTAGDITTVNFHIPHDYVPGTDLHAHVHWSLNNSVVETVLWEFNSIYAKGHGQDIFNTTPMVTSISQSSDGTPFKHLLAETPISSAAGTSNVLFANSRFEPDGVLIVGVKLVSYSGGSKPFIHFIDLHYQSTNLATKGKEPSFY